MKGENEATFETNMDRPHRIPITLQAVFLESSRGFEVHTPPPDRVANKTYFRSWYSHLKNLSGRSSSRNGVSRQGMLSLKPASLRSTASSAMNPQRFLDAMLKARGYSTQRYQTLQTAYYNKPTPLQEASYDLYLIGLVRRNDVEEMDKVLSCGISPNPCNKFGESLVHTVCRRGRTEILRVLVNHGCCLQVSDDYGRTPLHDACWAPQPDFDMIHTILQHDVRMFYMVDSRGEVPLSYAREEHWSEWIQFLESNKDLYWPIRDVTKTGKQGPPDLAFSGPNTRPLPDPKNALPLQLTRLLVSGRMDPNQVKFPHNAADDRIECRNEDDADGGLSEDGRHDMDSSDSECPLDDGEIQSLLADLPIVYLSVQQRNT